MPFARKTHLLAAVSSRSRSHSKTVCPCRDIPCRHRRFSHLPVSENRPRERECLSLRLDLKAVSRYNTDIIQDAFFPCQRSLPYGSE